ncbi:MAG: hypothetical protein HY748_14330 [Elusimicrobia bacterium]|nr:hypothetical protein [Elusimicrobiota bacterium]
MELSNYHVLLKASDREGNDSYLKVSASAGYDGSKNYLTYLSASALGAKKTEFDNFALYHAADVPGSFVG